MCLTKRLCAILIMLALIAPHDSFCGRYEEHVGQKFAIGCWGAGFFSSFFAVLNNIYWCEQHQKTPVVIWGTDSLYYQNEGYNGIKDNAWEYYFEPVSTLTYSKEDDIIASYFVPGETLISILHENHYLHLFNKAYRKKVSSYLKKYITIKPIIQNKIDDFYNKHMNNHTIIGIHFRGTDKFMEVEPIKVETMCNIINDSTKDIEDPLFLICTDEERILSELQQKLNGKSIFYDAYRSKNGKAIHLNNDHGYNKAKLGEEVLIEAVLLSRCHMFFHTCSNVSSAVIFLNPEIDNRLVLPGKVKPITN
jgi:hypothetical protein